MNEPTTPPYVRQGERVLWVGKPTLMVLVSNAFGFLFFLVIAGIYLAGNEMANGSRLQAFVPIIALLLFALVILLNALRLRRTEFVITDQGVYTRSGIIGQSVIQTTHDKITDIALRQDILGRLFGYSTLNVNTAGSNTAPVHMQGLPRALETKQRIEQARDVFLQRGRTPRPAEAARPLDKPLPRFTLDRDIVVLGCPVTKKTFKLPRASVGSRVTCPHCGKQHVPKEADHGPTA